LCHAVEGSHLGLRSYRCTRATGTRSRMWRLSTASGWLTRLALALLVTLSRFRLDQEQSVIELDAGIAKLKPIKFFAALPISGAKKISALCTTLNRVRKNVAVF